MSKVLRSLLLLFPVVSALGQDPSQYEQFLVPLTAHEVRGANGSIWTTELSLYNPNFTAVDVYGRICPDTLPVICETRSDVGPQSTERVRLYARSGGGDGAFLYVPKEYAGEIVKQLRVRDRSAEQEGWGTEVPVVRASERYADFKTLIDIPTDPRYRASLRIYGRDERPVSVTVRVYPASGVQLLDELHVTLHGIETVDPVALPLTPSYASLDPITAAVRASGHDRVRIAVSSDADPLQDPPVLADIWAFVSLTNNATQQVTIISPQE